MNQLTVEEVTVELEDGSTYAALRRREVLLRFGKWGGLALPLLTLHNAQACVTAQERLLYHVAIESPGTRVAEDALPVMKQTDLLSLALPRRDARNWMVQIAYEGEAKSVAQLTEREWLDALASPLFRTQDVVRRGAEAFRQWPGWPMLRFSALAPGRARLLIADERGQIKARLHLNVEARAVAPGRALPDDRAVAC